MIFGTGKYSLTQEIRFISSAIEDKLNGSQGYTIEESTTKQLMATLMQRDDLDNTLYVIIKSLL